MQPKQKLFSDVAIHLSLSFARAMLNNVIKVLTRLLSINVNIIIIYITLLYYYNVVIIYI